MKKIYITLIFVLALVFALVIVSSATDLLYTSDQTALEDMTTEGVSYDGSVNLSGVGYGYYISYGNVPNGNFVINLIEVGSGGYYGYVYWLSSYEAFQTRYNNYTVDEIFGEWVNEGLYNLLNLTGDAVEYFLTYQPVDTSTMVDWSTVDTVVKDWYINDYDAPVYENIDISSESSLNAFLNDNVNVATEYSKQNAYSEGYGVGYDTAENEANTTISELNTTINNLEISLDEALENGYAQGMADADAVERGVMSIVGAPMYILTSVFDVEIFGINLLNLITTIMTIIIVAWVIKKLAN